jgi:hypothetical protein
LLRREGRLAYDWIADNTRWMRKPRSYDSVEDALISTAQTYRRNLWRFADEIVEVWIDDPASHGKA